jgi:hypothetical protein
MPNEKPRKLIKITEHYKAERRKTKSSIATDVEYWDTPDAKYGQRFITIHASQELNATFTDTEWEDAKINWSALGSVATDDAAEFAKALAWAVKEAKRIDKKTGVTSK